jgi:multiple sugar transport system permease protein
LTTARTKQSPSWNQSYTRWQRLLAPYIFISPFFILFLIFGIFPMIFSVYVSLTSWDAVSGLGGMKFVGLDNYRFLLAGLFDPSNGDTDFWNAIRQTGYIALISGLPQHLIAIPLAFMIHTGMKRMQGFVTAIYFAPFVTSVAAVTAVFGTLYSERSGVLNWVNLEVLNKIPVLNLLISDTPIRWLGDRHMIPISIAILVIWRYTGWNVVLYLAGLQAIPKDLYEAAEVDGATRFQQFRYITLPLLRPTMFAAVTFTIIGNMQLFIEPFLLVNAGGGVANAGRTSVLYLWDNAFNNLLFGDAAAQTWVLFAIIVSLTALNNWFFTRIRGDEQPVQVKMQRKLVKTAKKV